MQFKNLSVFSFSGKTTPEDMPLLTEAKDLTTTLGFIPVNYGTGEMSVSTSGATLYKFGIDEKIIPSSVLKQQLEKKVREIELNENRKVGRKEKNDIKDEIAFSLIPRAFNKTTSTFFYIDTISGLLFVDSCSKKMIDNLYSLIELSFSELTIDPLTVESSPTSIMTDWLLQNSLPRTLNTGDKCVIKNEESSISFKGLEPMSEDTTRHLEEGMLVDSLSLEGMLVDSLSLFWSESLSFTLSSNLDIKDIKFLDSLMDLHRANQGDQGDDLISDLNLNVLTFRTLIDNMKEWFA